jgi:hypothetical protein
MQMEKYSIGIGDRFGRQGKAQLAAMLKARDLGVEVIPVWNKSHREHTIIGSAPRDVRAEADAAVKALSWKGSYHVDADHIGLKNVDLFVDASDFFTLDVADFIGKSASEEAIQAFVSRYHRFVGKLQIPGIQPAPKVTETSLREIAAKYVLAVREAGRTYRHIEKAKGKGKFITEVSMDETAMPQTPLEMFFILGAIAEEGIPAQTIAPRFTGRFNKGVDYVGDVAKFEREFHEALAVIAHAIREFGLPPSLKLSVHSGSDKFSLYGPIQKAIRKHKAGLHLKTAGTTWLEELIGLAAAGGKALELATEVYAQAFSRFDELCAPYATVVDIDKSRLPTPAAVSRWSSQEFVAALAHDPACKSYNPHLRQLVHVGYKVAAEMGSRYYQALDEFEETVAERVTTNLFDRHIRPLFLNR